MPGTTAARVTSRPCRSLALTMVLVSALRVVIRVSALVSYSPTSIKAESLLSPVPSPGELAVELISGSLVELPEEAPLVSSGELSEELTGDSLVESPGVLPLISLVELFWEPSVAVSSMILKLRTTVSSRDPPLRFSE